MSSRLLDWDGRGDRCQGAEWSAPDRITVTTAREVRVFTLAPDGDPGSPAVTLR